MFEKITDEKIKESIISSYNELLTQIKTLPGFAKLDDETVLKTFDKDYVKGGKLPSFVKDSLKNSIKAKSDYEKGKITVTEVNKVQKEMRLILSEIKDFRDKNVLNEVNGRKLVLKYDENKLVEFFTYDSKVYLIEFSQNKVYMLEKDKFIESKIKKEEFNDSTKFTSLEMSINLIEAAKIVLKTKSLFI